MPRRARQQWWPHPRLGSGSAPPGGVSHSHAMMVDRARLLSWERGEGEPVKGEVVGWCVRK
jgi:hypothetical protein